MPEVCRWCGAADYIWYGVGGCMAYMHVFDAPCCRECFSRGVFRCIVCNSLVEEYAVFTREGWYTSWGEIQLK
jgi:hypothetical protein